jgi:PAS domain S-box-containing protein
MISEPSTGHDLHACILNSQPIGVLTFSKTFHITSWNRSLENQSFLVASEVIGKPLFDILSYHSFSSQQLTRIIQKEEISGYVGLNGKEAAVICVPLISGQGEVLGGVMSFEILEQVSKPKSLAQMDDVNQYMVQVFDKSSLGMVMLDLGFNIVKINEGFTKIFEFSSEDIVGKNLNLVLVPEDKLGEAESLNDLVIAGQIDFFESVRLNKSGEIIPVVIYAFPIISKELCIGYFGVYIDIHERVSIEDELKVRNLELDHFVYKVSHDLRAPLASILGLINLTKLEKKPETQSFYVDLMQEQVEKLDHFIHDILSHSKNLKLDVVSSEIDFNSIITTCFEDLAYLEAAPHIKSNIIIEGSGFVSDKWRIGEIFRNLVSNAIKYSNPESDNKRINITVKVEEDGCHITISDNGVGIPEEYLPKIFDMFYRGTDTSDGSGIGLYIVKNAITKLQGTMEIASKSRQGTSFQIYLPSLIKV